MIIKSAEFVKSGTQPEHYPAADFPEIAFAGRSNVGKSSLINTLVNRKHLVKTSSTPGRTQLINFFMINQNLSLVDLPGYGYAKVPQRISRQWGPMVETYLAGRPNLKGVVMLIDVRRTPMADDLQLIQFVRFHQIHLILVLTKADKLSKSRLQLKAKSTAELLAMPKDRILRFSAKTRLGREALWEQINSLLAADNTL